MPKFKETGGEKPPQIKVRKVFPEISSIHTERLQTKTADGRVLVYKIPGLGAMLKEASEKLDEFKEDETLSRVRFKPTRKVLHMGPEGVAHVYAGVSHTPKITFDHPVVKDIIEFLSNEFETHMGFKPVFSRGVCNWYETNGIGPHSDSHRAISGKPELDVSHVVSISCGDPMFFQMSRYGKPVFKISAGEGTFMIMDNVNPKDWSITHQVLRKEGAKRFNMSLRVLRADVPKSLEPSAVSASTIDSH